MNEQEPTPLDYAPANRQLDPRKRLAIAVALSMMLISISIILLNQRVTQPMPIVRLATPTTHPIAGH
jgi:hypothetical protein